MDVRDSRSLYGRVRRMGWRLLWLVAARCLHLWLSDPPSADPSGARFDHGVWVPYPR